MLDLIITYFNFIVIALKYIVKRISFQPPDPKGYRIKSSDHEVYENNEKLHLNPGDIIEILFLVPNKPKPSSKNKSADNIIEKQKVNKEENIEENKEIIIKRNQKFEYKEATNKYSNFELIHFDNEDNNTIIPAFLFSPLNTDYSYTKDYIIIYCHGNSGDIGTSFMECQFLSYNLTCKVLCFEYPGYGLSTDINFVNDEKRAYFNIRQAYKYAKNQLNFKPENIFIYGFSLGTGIAFDLACDKDYPTGGVILQSAFLSIIRTLYNFRKTYYFDLFNNCDKAKFCCSKIYFIHGDKDAIVPYIHGRILSKLIPQELFCGFYTVPGANHNDILKFAKRTLYEKINEFIETFGRNRGGGRFSDSELSYNINIDEKSSIKNKYGKKANYGSNEINNNMSSNDELNVGENEKEKDEKYRKNEISVNFKNSTSNSDKKENIERSKEENIECNNEKSDSISKKKEEESKIEESKLSEQKNIKLNVDNYNAISKSNDRNNNDSNSNDISISFENK